MTDTFADLGVPDDLVHTMSARGIRTPSPIQRLTLRDGCAGRDISAQAPTGSGKTLAFGVPLATRVPVGRPGKPGGLVLVPTRELAAQVAQELEWIGAGRRLRVTTVYGGVGIGAQRAALRRGVDIVVACPGRLTDLVERGDAHLGEIGVVVVDEADRMADMGFLPTVGRLLQLTPSGRQTMLFSATLEGPVADLLRRYQRHPVRHSAPPSPEHAARSTHVFWDTPDGHRLRLCAHVVAASRSTIVFCRTKRRTDQLSRKLNALGVRTAAIHGDRSQGQRDRALRAFARGEVEALVATDVAARGLHVDDVACVLHWDPPADVTAYTHRAGRTARAGAAGIVISLVGPEQRRLARGFQRDLGLTERLTRPDPSMIGGGDPSPSQLTVDRGSERTGRGHGPHTPRRTSPSARGRRVDRRSGGRKRAGSPRAGNGRRQRRSG